MTWPKYLDLWAEYRKEFPISSKLPLLGIWFFGHYAKGYFDYYEDR